MLLTSSSASSSSSSARAMGDGSTMLTPGDSSVGKSWWWWRRAGTFVAPAPCRGVRRRGLACTRALAGWSGVVGWRSAFASASAQLSASDRARSLLGPSARPAASAPCRNATAAAPHWPRCSRSAPRLWHAIASSEQASRPGTPPSPSPAPSAMRRRVASTAIFSASSWLPMPESAAQAFSFVFARPQASAGESRPAASSARSARPR
mmetsp:Transcript_57719/g.162783  ORF Transcript_57719/g.162783 Transcript_57719/m.162783 type:complete len:207 (+) Transcript_57719:148-768(+)